MRKDIVKELAEKNIENLRIPCKFKMSDGWATLHIRIDSMNEEQRNMVWEAMSLLSRAGIGFDSGCGCGNIDWELDWSLRGAYMTIKQIRCRGCEKKFPWKDNKDVVWVRTKRLEDNYISEESYCSIECAKETVPKRKPTFIILGWWKNEK